MIVGMEKSRRILENCNADPENKDVYYTGEVVIAPAFVNFLAFHETNHHKFKVRKFGALSIFRGIR